MGSVIIIGRQSQSIGAIVKQRSHLHFAAAAKQVQGAGDIHPLAGGGGSRSQERENIVVIRLSRRLFAHCTSRQQFGELFGELLPRQLSL